MLDVTLWQVIANDFLAVDVNDSPIVAEDTQDKRLELARIIDLKRVPEVIGRIMFARVADARRFVTVPVTELCLTSSPRGVIEIGLPAQSVS